MKIANNEIGGRQKKITDNEIGENCSALYSQFDLPIKPMIIRIHAIASAVISKMLVDDQKYSTIIYNIYRLRLGYFITKNCQMQYSQIEGWSHHEGAAGEPILYCHDFDSLGSQRTDDHQAEKINE